MAARRRVVLLPEARDVLRRLPPATKRKERAALDALQSDPALGEPLHRELTGRFRVRVGSLRIVYRVAARNIVVSAIGPRRTIYLDLEREARAEGRDAAEG